MQHGYVDAALIDDIADGGCRHSREHFAARTGVEK